MNLTKISDLRIGNIIDLEKDKHADPKHDNVSLAFSFQTVLEITQETPDCILIECEAGAFGFPPSHMVDLIEI